MTRKKVVAGNWKMNTTLSEAKALVQLIVQQTNESDDILKIIIPPFPYLESIGHLLLPAKNFFLGAQNCHTRAAGAYTGEVAASMLASVGCKYVLIGHSERRRYFKENETDLILKIKEALLNNLNPILCVGETLQERKANQHFKIITHQLTTVLSALTQQEFFNCMLAYEPVWAIGTGETASPEQAQEIHEFIRTIITGLYSKQTAEATSILYGGSCNAQNAKALFSGKDVDGGLIGGASLKADEFCNIMASF